MSSKSGKSNKNGTTYGSNKNTLKYTNTSQLTAPGSPYSTQRSVSTSPVHSIEHFVENPEHTNNNLYDPSNYIMGWFDDIEIPAKLKVPTPRAANLSFEEKQNIFPWRPATIGTVSKPIPIKHSRGSRKSRRAALTRRSQRRRN